jgi:HK97 family phage prohead protease
MKKNTETILEQIVELAQSVAEHVPVGELATFSDDGFDYVASVEDYVDGIYTLRILAQAGSEFEPTDDVRKVDESLVEAYHGDVQGLKEGDDVEVETEDGDTKGVITEVSDKVSMEVYSLHEGKYEPTGVVIQHEKEHVRKCSFVKSEVKKKLLWEIKEAKVSEEEGVIEAKLSSYGAVDLGGDTVQKGAYNQTIKHKNGKVKFFLDHWYGVKDLVGVAYLEDKEDGLYMKGHVPLDSPTAKDAFIKVKFMIAHGEPIGVSIGYDTIKSKMLPDGTRVLQEIALHEASLTPFPMDLGAITLSAKSRKIAYQAKKRMWQTPKSDAPDGNQYTEGEFKSLLSSIRTEILNQGL